jgi:histone-lysine N-methyltransferase SETD3
MSVAARDLQPGDVALSIPDKLTVTLDRIFENESLAELLTTGGRPGWR